MRLDESQWRHSVTDPVKAVAAVKQLVIAETYVLVALGSAPPAWMTCEHPTGQHVVPCFLSESSARKAAAGRAQVVRVQGRDLFGSLASNVAWIDPDQVGLLLTPELVDVLLSTVPTAPAIGTDSTLKDWADADDLPAPVRTAWEVVMRDFPAVRSAYWLQHRAVINQHRRLVVLTSDTVDTPRLLDAMVVALRASYAGSLRIEAQALAEGQVPEAQSRLAEFRPFFKAHDSDRDLRELGEGYSGSRH